MTNLGLFVCILAVIAPVTIALLGGSLLWVILSPILLMLLGVGIIALS